MPQPTIKELEACVLLNSVDCIGGVRSRKLRERFGHPTETLKASAHELTSSGILSPDMVKRLFDFKKRFNAKQEIDEAHKNAIKILTFFDDAYPAILKEIFDAPSVLYVKGSFEACDANSIGVVGSRGASFYGLTCAKEFSSYFARSGLTVVSGMARGIDTSAHRAALDSGGRTIAVLGSGLLDIYPPENEGLYDEISKKGAVISEFPLHTPPLARNFPIRNRIISGLSRGVLVVEATQKSGALITARFASEQGREVFAVPGKVSSDTSSGANDLIKQGAKMSTTPQEVLEDLRFNFSVSGLCPTGDKIQAKNLTSDELAVVGNLSDEPVYFDDISSATGMKAADLLSVLTQLELKKIVKQLPGKTFVRLMN